MQQTIKLLQVKEDNEKDLLSLHGVLGVGLGLKITGGKTVGPECIMISVEKKRSVSEQDSSQMIPKDIHGFPTDVFEIGNPMKVDTDAAKTGDVRAYMPLCGGIRIAPTRLDPQPGYGTLGLIVRGPNGKPSILTNYHVINVGPVMQPGQTRERVADFVLGNQDIDCSVSDLNEFATWTNWITEIGSIVGAHEITLYETPFHVRKRGYRTGFSYGDVIALNQSGVDSEGRKFSGAMMVSCDQDSFNGGDSGSVLVDDANNVVGLLFAFSNERVAYAQPIHRVIEALSSGLYTDNMPRLYAVHEGPYKPGKGDGYLYGTSTDSTLAEISKDESWPPNQAVYGTWAEPCLVAFKSLYQATYDPNIVKDTLYCIHSDRSGSGLWYGVFNGSGWSNDHSDWLKYASEGPPTAAVYDGKLYIFFALQNKWLAAFRYDGFTLENYGLIPPGASDTYGTNFGPAVTTFKGKLWLVHQQIGGTGNLMRTHLSSEGWSDDVYIVTTSQKRLVCSSRPGLITFRDKLFLVFDGPSNDGLLYYSTSDGEIWTDQMPMMQGQNQLRSSAAINLVVHNDVLLCMREGPYDSEKIHCAFTHDGIEWNDIYIHSKDAEYIMTHSAPGLAHIPVNMVKHKE